jgi:hypothetical protein
MAGAAAASLMEAFHQALDGEANHVAQNICIRGLFDAGAQVHHVPGHRRVLGWVCVHNPA